VPISCLAFSISGIALVETSVCWDFEQKKTKFNAIQSLWTLLQRSFFNHIIISVTEPVITASLEEDIEATTANTIVLTYGAESQDGVFDYYEFSIDLNQKPDVIKDITDPDRRVLFTQLTAGLEHTVTAKVYSGQVPSSTSKTIKITTST